VSSRPPPRGVVRSVIVKSPTYPVSPDDLGVGQDDEVRLGLRLVDEAMDQRPCQVFRRENRVQLDCLAAEERRLLHERHGEALAGEIESGPKTGDAAADDERPMDGRDADLLERLEHLRLGDRCANERARFLRRGLGL